MPSANINFDGVPSTIRKPGIYTEFNTRMAVNTLPANLYRVLIIGQRLAAGTVLANTPVDIFSDEDAAVYFGRGSIAHLAVRAAIKANRYLSLQCIALDDASAGVVATGTVTIAGPATGSGALRLTVNKTPVDIAIASGDTASIIAAALNAQIALQSDLPVTATVLAGVVTLAAKHKGAMGNTIKLATVVQASGVTATVAAMVSGLNDPDITPALAAVYTAGHSILICSFNDTANLTALRTHVNAVSGPQEKRYVRAVVAHTGTYAQSTTLAASINSGLILEVLDPNAGESVYEVAAVMGAIAASEEDPARPLNGMELVGLTPPPMANWLSEVQIEAALHNGVTPTRVGPGNVVQIVRAITSYTLNANGVPDISMLDWTTAGTLHYVAKAIEQRIGLRFPRDKKTLRTRARLGDEIYNVLIKLEELEIIEQVAKSDVLIEDDLVDPSRYDVRIKVNVVNGLHVIAQRLDLIL
jgi:phage tail sheath gpL-like